MNLRQPLSPRIARGFVMLDALIAIVIFSIGILGMVAMQAAAVNYATDAQYRSRAANFADQVIGQMWGADPAQLATIYAGSNGSGGAGYLAWNTLIQTVSNSSLPGTTTYPPSIVVAGNNLVTVTVQWLAPSEVPPPPALPPPPHQYVSVTQITR